MGREEKEMSLNDLSIFELKKQINEYENKVTNTLPLSKFNISLELSKNESILSCCYSQLAGKIFLITNKHAFPVDSESGFVCWKMKSSSLNHFSSSNKIFCEFMTRQPENTITEIIVVQVHSKKQKLLCIDVIDIATGCINKSEFINYLYEIPKQIAYCSNQDIYLVLERRIESYFLASNTFQIVHRATHKLPKTISIDRIIPIYFCLLPIVVVKCRNNLNWCLLHVENSKLIQTTINCNEPVFAMHDGQTREIHISSENQIDSFKELDFES